jgi:hypothetical protein
MSGLIKSTTADAVLSSLRAPAGAALVGVGTRTLADKLAEAVSVKDAPSNAKGDGTADDKAAISAAVGANNQVRFTKGDYLVASSLNIPGTVTLVFDAGARLIIPDGVTLTFANCELKAGGSQIFKCTGTGKVEGTIRNPLIMPEWWGAIADGLWNPVNGDFAPRAAAAARNGVALQAAAKFAGFSYATNGLTNTVLLSPGFYVSDKTFSIPLSVNVIGYGIGSAIFYYAAAGNAVECIDGNNSLLSDFFIAPIAGPTWNVSTGCGLYMKGVSTPCVRNIWSSGFAGGTFYFENVIEGRIDGLISDNANGPAFMLRGVGQGTVLRNCLTAATDGGPCFDIQSGYDWHLIGCTAKNGASTTGTQGYYLNGVENINLTACGGHNIKREGFLLTATALNCTLNGCFVNDASIASVGTYSAFNISGTRNRLIAPKVTSNTPKYNYGITYGGGATDCGHSGENITPGTLGSVLDAQPIGLNPYHVRKVSTTDAVAKTVWTKNLNNNAGAVIKATVFAKQREGAGAGATAYFELYACVKTNATSTTFATGPTKTVNFASTAGLNADLVISTATGNAGVVSLQVTGLASAYAVDWEAEVKVMSVTG